MLIRSGRRFLSATSGRSFRRQLRELPRRAMRPRGGWTCGPSPDASRGARAGPRSISPTMNPACCWNGSRGTRCRRARHGSFRTVRSQSSAAGSAEVPAPITPIVYRSRFRQSATKIGGSGRFGRFPSRPCRAVTDDARARTPIDAFLLEKMEPMGLTFRPMPMQRHWSAARPSICWACHLHPRSSMPYQTTIARMPSSGWSTACWRRRTSASAGAATGWTSRAMSTRSASTPTRPTSSRAKGSGSIATM